MAGMAQAAPEEAPAEPGPASVLRVDDVAFAYRGTPVLRGVSLTVEPGESLALLGANGAGKTTLLELCAGTREPADGTIAYASGIAVGWVPPTAAYYGRLSARENLRTFCRLEGVADPRARADALLTATGLADAGDRRADRLSTGMGQRLNLAIALAGRPDLLLLDEPTATLSPDQRLRFWELIDGQRAGWGTAVVFSTQSVAEAGRRADRMLVLADGAVAFCGDLAELAAHSSGGVGTDAAEAAFIALAGE